MKLLWRFATAVTEELDGGPVAMHATVPVLDDDTPETLAARSRRG